MCQTRQLRGSRCQSPRTIFDIRYGQKQNFFIYGPAPQRNPETSIFVWRGTFIGELIVTKVRKYSIKTIQIRLSIGLLCVWQDVRLNGEKSATATSHNDEGQSPAVNTTMSPLDDFPTGFPTIPPVEVAVSQEEEGRPRRKSNFTLQVLLCFLRQILK